MIFSFKQFLILGFIFSTTTRGASSPPTGKWSYGRFSPTSFWGTDGSYKGAANEQAMALHLQANGTFEIRQPITIAVLVPTRIRKVICSWAIRPSSLRRNKEPTGVRTVVIPAKISKGQPMLQRLPPFKSNAVMLGKRARRSHSSAYFLWSRGSTGRTLHASHSVR